MPCVTGACCSGLLGWQCLQPVPSGGQGPLGSGQLLLGVSSRRADRAQGSAQHALEVQPRAPARPGVLWAMGNLSTT